MSVTKTVSVPPHVAAAMSVRAAASESLAAPVSAPTLTPTVHSDYLSFLQDRFENDPQVLKFLEEKLDSPLQQRIPDQQM